MLSTDSGRSPEQGIVTSGGNISFWLDTVEQIRLTPLQSNLETDVVIVGAGIAGMTIAYCLLKSGRQVVVLEDGYVGSGETGRTTAHLVNCLDDRYTTIEEMHGEDGAKLAAQSHTAAIDFIEKTIQQENIDCGFRRVSGYLFLHPSDERKTLEEELKATHRAGIDTFLLNDVPALASEISPCLEFPQQGQFHIMKYLRGLTEAIIKMGGKIFTETHVKDINKKGVKTNGHAVTANHIVVATNTPVNNVVSIHTKQFPYRTYVIGATIPKGIIEPALWWDTGDLNSKLITKPYHYVRLHEYSDEYDLLISGGEDHRTGQAEKIAEEKRYQALEDWTRKRFPAMQQIIYRWSGQVLEPLDHLAFIGRNPGDKNIYIVTGDSGNGMTHGTIAGILIADLINELPNRWEKLYDPSRITLKVTGDYFTEVKNMAAQYIDFLAPGDIESAKELQPNQGGILALGFKKVAVFKDETGSLHAFSAICPHLGCVVQWNGEEKSFDCPCHGSRFTGKGTVINGPAMSDLKRIEITEKIKA